MIYAERTGRHPAALHAERRSAELQVFTHLPRSEWATSLLAAEPSITSFSRISEANAPGTGGFFVAREDVGHASDAVLEFEKDVRTFFLNALNTAKARDGGTCRALDIGSNGGFFALLARASGCEVIAIDAQPRCIQRLASASAINGWASGLTAVWAAIGDGGGSVEVGATRCSGLWAVKGSAWIDAESEHNVSVRVLPLVEVAAPFFIGQRIAVMKIDTEGSELAVLHSALPMLEEQRVDAFVAEFAPRRTADITPFADVAQTLRRVYKAGYRCIVNGRTVTLDSILAHFDPAQHVIQGLKGIDHYYCKLDKNSSSLNVT